MADTSVLLNLARIARVELLPSLFGDVFIPPEVAEEFRWQASANPRFAGLTLPAWLRTQSAATIPAWVNAAPGLDRGESRALALASELRADAVLIDEEAGRAVAERLGLQVIVILGILLRAKARGCIQRVTPELDALQEQARFWVSESLRRDILRAAGEIDQT